MASRLGDRLNVARRRQFVGRVAERDLFQSALAAAELPFQVLYVFGPGGVGKTSLLLEFTHLCTDQTRATYLDARSIEPTPDAFLSALKRALDLTPQDAPLEWLAARPFRPALLLDTYETLAPLRGWLNDVFLPQLPANTLLVLAGREPPPPAWQADPGWQSVIHLLPLRNLSPQESRTYLTQRAVPVEQQSEILDFTHGHPLALSLVSDALAQRPGLRFQPASTPDVIKTLLERFVQMAPGPAHRAALEACALVRVTNEALLAEMLGMPDPSTLRQGSGQANSGQGPHELFEWLRGLSFIQSRPGGLFPHDLAREALDADLRWRNPDWYAELHRRARNYYVAHIQQSPGQAQQRTLLDLIFLHRHNAVVRPFFEWQTSGGVLADALREDDVPALLDMVARHEGSEAARLAQHWLAQQPEGVLVLRDSKGQPAGVLVMVALHQAATEDLAADPATRCTWDHLQRHAPLRPGERATLFRFWLAADTYQAVSPIQSLLFVHMVRHYLTTPGLAFTFIPCAAPDFWAPVFAYADLVRLPAADFEVDGRGYGVYGHDWRAAPPAAWLGMLAERELGMAPAAATPPPPAEPLIVLSESEFAAAALEALRNESHPDALRGNPLLRSRLVVAQAGPDAPTSERVAALQALLKAAAEELRQSPRELKFYRALYHTYFQPAATQEQAAEILDLPFSTFRRHLTAGVKRMTERLWQWEIGGS